ncbi:MAG: O-antigen ligase family protein [Armatimonadota bacterium]|nr:MAG: O-antigen ligase family protein [Armatimonadota bacterium]
MPGERTGAACRLEALAFAFLTVAVFTAPFGSNIHVPGHPSIFLYRIFFVLFVMVEAVRLALLRRLRLPSLRHPAAPWMAIAAWAAISLVWVVSLGAGVRYVGCPAPGATLTCAIAGYGRDRRRLAVMLGAAAGSFLVVLAAALFERETGYRFPTSNLRDPELTMRFRFLFTSVFHNVNDLATFLAMWLPLLLVVYLHRRRLWARIIALGLSCIVGFLIVASLSRANTLAAVTALLVIFALSVRRRFGAWAVLIAGAVLVVVFMPAMPRYFVRQAVVRLAHEMALGVPSQDIRMKLTQESLILLKHTYGLGVGAGNIEARLEALRAEGGGRATRILNMHNWWLEVLANLGVIGFVLYVFFYVRLLRDLALAHLRLRNQDEALAALCLGLLAALVGFMVGCMSTSSLVSFKPMWILFGFGLAASYLADRQRC